MSVRGKVAFFVRMPRLTKDQRVWVCLEYARVDNAFEVKRRWLNQWPNDPAPSDLTIKKTYDKFVREGTCLNLHKGRSGPRKTARTQANINAARQSLQQDGKRSSRRNGLNLTRSYFLRIVHLDLKFHPYVLIKRKKLKPGDPALRLQFCNDLVTKITNDPGFLNKLIVSDEAIFSLNSEVNTRNVVKYSAFGNGHPDDHYVEFEQGPGKIMVWMGLTREGKIFGPHVVRNRLDTREYLRIVRYNVVQREFARNNINQNIMWWQQDGAPSHTSNATLQYLRGRVLSKGGDWHWPARSPDLAVCDFFLWGHLKQKIWEVPVNQQPQNLDELEDKLREACDNLNLQFIRNAFDAMVTRARKCIAVGGGLFPNE
eukprot:TCONS_00053258-protein